MLRPNNEVVIGDSVIYPPRSADQAFVMGLCLVFSVPVLFGKAPAPGSIDALLPHWMVYGWAATLAAGSIAVLTSYIMRDRVVSIIVEQFGSICIGIAALAYSVAIFAITYDNGGAISGTIILGFAFTRLYQAWRYQIFLRRVRMVLNIVDEEGEAHGDQR